MRRWRWAIPAAALTLAACATAAPARAAADPDQAQAAEDSNTMLFVYDPVLLAQTFTAGIGGGLERVDLRLVRDPLAALPLVVQIRNVAADGRPGNQVLASGPVAASAVPASDVGWVSATLPRSPSVAGARYALVVSAPGAPYGQSFLWGAGSLAHGLPQFSDLYPGGQPFRSGDGATWEGPFDPGDFAFRTFVVTPPETAIDAGPPAATTDTTASFSFSSPRAGMVFDCRLDSGAWQRCTSPSTIGGLGIGPHAYAVRAVDDPLPADPSPAEWSWTVTAPVPAAAVPTSAPAPAPASPVSRTRLAAGARLRLVLSGAAPCLTGTTVRAGLTAKRVRAPFVRVSRVRFSVGGGAGRTDRRAPVGAELSLPRSLAPGAATTVRAAVTLRLTRGRTSIATLAAPVRRCG